MIKAYFTDTNTQTASKYFKSNEFKCKDGSNVVFIDDNLVTVLHAIRNHFGVPVTINSGYRTYAHNKKQGGASKSQHMLGKAADIVVKGKTPKEVFEYAKTLTGAKGIGLYKSFVHVDVRDGNRTTWNG